MFSCIRVQTLGTLVEDSSARGASPPPSPQHPNTYAQGGHDDGGQRTAVVRALAVDEGDRLGFLGLLLAALLDDLLLEQRLDLVGVDHDVGTLLAWGYTFVTRGRGEVVF